MLKHPTAVTRRFTFEAAHRLVNHTGKCRFLHGHSYNAEVVVAPERVSFPTKDEENIIIDFATMKTLIGGWIDTNWDHNTILSSNDPIVLLPPYQTELICGRMPYIMKCGAPTAEAMANELIGVLQERFDSAYYSEVIKYRIKVVAVTIQETENCEASCGI